MKKTFMGLKLRRLRAERGLSQTALAHTLGISPSYLNQIEQNQRPLTVSVLLKISQTLGVDVQQFSEDDEARLVAALREALADAPDAISLPELREVAAQMPALARAVLALHRRNAEAAERLEALALRLGDERGGGALPRALPFEAVRDFFFAHQNHFDALDRAAEALAHQAQAHAQAPVRGGALAAWLQQRLQQQHGVHVRHAEGAQADKRRYEPATRTLFIAAALTPSQQAFQMGTQLALLELGEAIDAQIDASSLAYDAAARRLAWPPRLGAAAQAVFHRPGLRHPARAPAGLCPGAGPERPRRSHPHRHGLQGMRTRPMPATRLPLRGPRAGSRRKPQLVCALQRLGACPKPAHGRESAPVSL